MGAALRRISHALWASSCAPEYRAFRRAIRDVESVQRAILVATLRRNAQSEFGRRHGFEHVSTVDDYRRRVPISSYEDYAAFVERIADGESAVLTEERVRLFEPTGGSTGGTKLIPYTASLAREFRRGVDAWIADLLYHDRALWRGRSYWSISPVGATFDRTRGGIAVGFEDDAEYLGLGQRLLLGRLLAVPPDVRLIEDPDAFRYATLYSLLRCRDLGLISVWNPTFFTILLDRLETWWPSLVEDISHGAPRSFGLEARWSKRLAPDRVRASEIETVFRSTPSTAKTASALWPELRVVSCWADAAAEAPARVLASALPHAALQPKGLLATEAIVSFPLHGWPAPALAVRSHFLEFVPEGGDAVDAHGAHELETGCRYSVVVTTGGGLYRYALRDLVEVVGHANLCPLVRFIGKEDGVSDFFGEKLDERHAGSVVSNALELEGLTPRFVVLSCEPLNGLGAYTLFIEEHRASDATLIRLAKRIEVGLDENFHYEQCRRLGQLGPVRVIRIGPAGAMAFLDECRKRGQRLGDVKPATLYAGGRLSDALCGASSASFPRGS